jgi:hypothetical protein
MFPGYNKCRRCFLVVDNMQILVTILASCVAIIVFWALTRKSIESDLNEASALDEFYASLENPDTPDIRSDRSDAA